MIVSPVSARHPSGDTGTDKLLQLPGQLQKIGVLQSSRNAQATPGSAKRRSGQLDFSNIGPLKAGGTVGFSAFRDQGSEAARRKKARKKSNGNVADDSDDDDDESDALTKTNDDEKDGDGDVDGKLAADDSKFGGELADGVNRIRVSAFVPISRCPYRSR